MGPTHHTKKTDKAGGKEHDILPNRKAPEEAAPEFFQEMGTLCRGKKKTLTAGDVGQEMLPELQKGHRFPTEKRSCRTFWVF